jgi:hypothetical protein
MPPVRHSKRVQRNSPGEIRSTKRQRKPAISSLAAFDASRPPANVSKRGNGRRKARTLLGQSNSVSIAPIPKRGTRTSTVEISSTPPVATSPATAPSTTTPSKKSKNQPITNPFDPTHCWDKEPHHVQILITPNMEGKRKDKDLIILGIDLSDFVRDKLEGLQNAFYDDYVKGWEEDRDLTGGNRPRKLHWAVTIRNPKGNYQTIQVQNQKS